MDIKDIVNRSNIDLQNCDQEPIHIPGSIQPHGFLIAIDKRSMKLKFCSGNLHLFTGAAHGQLLEKDLSELVGQEALVQLQKIVSEDTGRPSNLRFELLDHAYEFIVHLSGNYLLLEGEKDLTSTKSLDLLELSKDFVRSMEETQTLKELCDLVAVSIRKITSYDRVMVYRFDEQYNGEVFAESKKEELESFYGLHYPHTDIPVQARALYIKNQLRIITDVNYRPVPIYTLTGADHSELDLSLSVLRSVSPIHIEYLQNMGVGATLTISLLLRNKLWGLIACHHYSEKYLSYDVRMSAKLLGHFITSQIDARLLNEEYETARKANGAVDHLTSIHFSLNRDSLKDLIANEAMLSICNANGVSLIVNGTLYKTGITPDDTDIRKLAAELAVQGREQFHTDSIVNSTTGIAAYPMPGINYFRLSGKTEDCIAWFRQESTREVNWAGDPAKAIEKDKNGLSPRKSFELWHETVKDHSKPWLQSEIKASQNFVNILDKHLNAILLAEEEEKQREMTVELKKINAELENINWISTHDLQEPLRKIQMMASMLLETEKDRFSDQAREKVGKMNVSAERMQNLIKDILKYTRLNYTSEAIEITDLNTVIAELKQEWAESFTEKNIDLSTGQLPAVRAVPFLARQLLYNLISNSLKFMSTERPGKISIAGIREVAVLPEGMALPLSAYHVIEYRDNGIGFEATHNESVFKIFSRLHQEEKYTGSGIGLALCRKIMTTHKGFITAAGQKDKGVTFHLFFPKGQETEN